MIRDLDASLTGWLSKLLPDLHVTFDRPAAAPAKGAAPQLHLFLVNLREDLSASSLAWTDMRADTGGVLGRTPPTRWLDLAYLVMVTAPDALTEHDALGRLLTETTLLDRLPMEHLCGSLINAEVRIRFAPAEPLLDPQHLWSAWGVAPRTSLELHVLAPVVLDVVADVAPAPGQIDLGVDRGSTRAADEPLAVPARPRPVGRISEG